MEEIHAPVDRAGITPTAYERTVDEHIGVKTAPFHVIQQGHGFLDPADLTQTIHDRRVGDSVRGAARASSRHLSPELHSFFHPLLLAEPIDEGVIGDAVGRDPLLMLDLPEQLYGFGNRVAFAEAFHEQVQEEGVRRMATLEHQTDGRKRGLEVLGVKERVDQGCERAVVGCSSLTGERRCSLPRLGWGVCGWKRSRVLAG